MILEVYTLLSCANKDSLFLFKTCPAHPHEPAEGRYDEKQEQSYQLGGLVISSVQRTQENRSISLVRVLKFCAVALEG